MLQFLEDMGYYCERYASVVMVYVYTLKICMERHHRIAETAVDV